MKTHYVYMLIDPCTNEFYYGSRTCECNAIDDVNYKGSMCRWQPDKSKLIKTIIKDDFETRTLATEYESNIISEHITDELNRNYHIPNKGFYIVGEHKKTHPFVSKKAMKKICKLYNIN